MVTTNDRTIHGVGGIFGIASARRLFFRRFFVKPREHSGAPCYALMMVTLTFVVVGILLQLGKLAQIESHHMGIRTAIADNRVLAAKVDNLESEFKMESRSEVVYQLATQSLGMVFPEPGQTVLLPINSNSDEGHTLLVSAQ